MNIAKDSSETDMDLEDFIWELALCAADLRRKEKNQLLYFLHIKEKLAQASSGHDDLPSTISALKPGIILSLISFLGLRFFKQ